MNLQTTLTLCGARLMVPSRLFGFEILVFRDCLGGTRKTEPNRFLTHRTWRELLLGDEGDFVFAAVLFVPDDVEAGFRHYFPRLEFFLWHIVLERRGTVLILLKYGVAAQ